MAGDIALEVTVVVVVAAAAAANAVIDNGNSNDNKCLDFIQQPSLLLTSQALIQARQTELIGEWRV